MEIISGAVKIEVKFVAAALPIELIGMNSAIMCNEIKFCADRLLITRGCRPDYKVGNPFECMETISLQRKTTFFEKQVGGVGVDPANQSLAPDTSF
jgi:ribonucleoside-diphosphate reductase subunit M2